MNREYLSISACLQAWHLEEEKELPDRADRLHHARHSEVTQANTQNPLCNRISRTQEACHIENAVLIIEDTG